MSCPRNYFECPDGSCVDPHNTSQPCPAVIPSTTPCPLEVYLSCDNGVRCYTPAQRCDNSYQCIDRSDEINCSYDDFCKEYKKTSCDGGKTCYGNADRCDDRPLCHDGADEFNCTYSDLDHVNSTSHTWVIGVVIVIILVAVYMVVLIVFRKRLGKVRRDVADQCSRLCMSPPRRENSISRMETVHFSSSSSSHLELVTFPPTYDQATTETQNQDNPPPYRPTDKPTDGTVQPCSGPPPDYHVSATVQSGPEDQNSGQSGDSRNICEPTDSPPPYHSVSIV